MSNKKKKKNIKYIDKKAQAEKEQLSSDSAIGWVFAMIGFTALLITILLLTVAASRPKDTAASEQTEAETIETMPEDAEAFESFTGNDEEESESAIYADIDVQDYGVITVQLDSDAAPLTVENFVNLAESGFYDGLTFHRIIDGFMIQGGDPTGTGSGSSGETIKGEFSSNGWDNPLSHTRGAISMARNPNDCDSASCQFFIVQSDSTYLDGDYACFGYVVSGMEYVDAICADAVPMDDNGSIIEEMQPVITSIVIRSA